MSLGLDRSVARAFLLLVAMGAGAATASAQLGAQEHPLALAEAISSALEKNDDLLIEHESLTAAEAEVDAARGAYDPVLGVEGAWWRSAAPVNSAFAGAPPGALAPEFESTDVGVGIRQLLPTGGEVSVRGGGGRETSDGTFTLLSPAYRTQAGVELRQPLLRDRAIDSARLLVRVAKAGRQGAAASLRRTVTETVAAVERAYWTLAAVRLAVNVGEEAIQLATEQLAETETRVESGVAPQTELAQPRAELERRRGELLEARETLVRAEDDLKLLMLADTDQTLWMARLVPVDSAAVEVPAVDLEGSLERALSARPELAESAAVIDRRKAETAFAQDGVWPALDVVASYDRFGLAGEENPAGPGDPIPPELDGGLGDSFGSLGDGDFDAARVALVLELPLLNRTARGQAAAARSIERQAEVALARTRKTIRAEVIDAAAQVVTAGQRIEAARSGREAAEIQLGAEQDRYATGLSTNFLVLTRQNDLSRARLNEISALTDYRTARTEMARATGSLLEERGIQFESIEKSGGEE